MTGGILIGYGLEPGGPPGDSTTSGAGPIPRATGDGKVTPMRVPPRRPRIAGIKALFARARGFVVGRLADGADLFMAAVILVSLTVSLVNQSWIVTGHALTASLVGFALCFLITSKSLKKRPDLGPERTFIGLAVMVSGVWLYEVAYHYGWLVPAQAFSVDASEFAISTPSGNTPFPLPWALLMIGLAFVGIRYMRINRWFLLCAALSIATIFLWIAIGYPNLFHPEWWPHNPLYLQAIPADFAHASTPQAANLIAFYGGLMNSVTKVLVSILPATLYLGQPPAHGVSGGGRRWRALLLRVKQFHGWPRDRVIEPDAPDEESGSLGDRVSEP